MFKFLMRNKIAMQEQPEELRCIDCAHFRNSPEYLEQEIKGLNTLSSGHASVRKDDGICLLHDLYLSAAARCDQFQPDTGSAVS